MEENRVCFIEIPEAKGRLSPTTPSPRSERNIGFFHALSKRFGRRSSHEDLGYNGEDDSRSSSTDSCSSTQGSFHHQSIEKDADHNSSLELSCGSSDTSSTADENEKSLRSSRLHRRSTSSIRRALENFSISTRSLSCNTTPSKQSKMPKKTAKKPPQRILRQPVSYTYAKGMSGLPTQRIPKSSCCNYARR